jgi:transcriptional regulator with XRE-family HTH domain
MSTDIRIEFGNRVRGLRKQRGLTQMDLAIDLGVGRSYLSQVERGLRDPGLRLVKSIADALSIPLSKLFENL